MPRVHACLLMTLFALIETGWANETDGDSEPIRIGIIGLDTSHVTAFTRSFNADPAEPEIQGCRVVAAYPKGSEDIESSYSRIPKYTQAVQAMGVEIVGSIDALLEKVDCVLLETNDGKPHLEQSLQVLHAGKRVFIDKPVAQDLANAVAIYQAAKYFQVPVFSSSSLRYAAGVDEIRSGEIGEVLGCDTYSPCSFEPSHVDLFWYGIHGVEPLFACMGTGCESVRCQPSEHAEIAIGTWTGNRIGVFRGIRNGKSGYGGTAFGAGETRQVGPYQGYQPLVREIASFFRSGVAPVNAEETLQIYAFMQAASESKRRHGASVTIAEVMADATRKASELLAGKLH
ncbi:MAG: Gfo/Idh/MocA family oxidoreductase [Planctomycetota bacterium]